MNLVNFEVLKNYESPSVYFCEHAMKHSCLIAIPSWNWSFLMDYTIDFKDEKPMLMKALEKYVSYDLVENVADAFYDYVFSELN
ncbi:YueH family protein [Bacillus toyonensis]|uniref:YueH family protein n=1 Tax=Bacillus toyonensis TaxID=155322 RepID=UPI0025413C37|nr:YueH family protein [Bacillus toyonensis]WIG25108.1 YueH family protein [Bacillus toyonensis]